MAVRKRRDVKRALKKKGFVQESKKRDHDFYFYVVCGEKTEIYTYVSRGKKYVDLSDNLIAAMSRQLKLTKAKFLELVDCPLTATGYRAFLEDEGHIEVITPPDPSTTPSP